MSRTQVEQVHFTCNGCGAEGAIDGVIEELDLETLDGWTTVKAWTPDNGSDDPEEYDFCPKCWVGGVRIGGEG